MLNKIIKKFSALCLLDLDLLIFLDIGMLFSQSQHFLVLILLVSSQSSEKLNIFFHFLHQNTAQMFSGIKLIKHIAKIQSRVIHYLVFMLAVHYYLNFFLFIKF